MAGIRPFQHPSGGHGEVRTAPLAPSQTFDAWDPVELVSNQLTECDKDGSEILDSEFIGFAAGPATGNLAGSRTVAAGSFTVQPGADGGGGGAVENALRGFITPYRGQLFATNNFFADATGAAQDGDGVGGSDIGGLYQIASAAGGNWGLVDAAGTPATDVCARIVRILNTRGEDFNADTADTPTTGSPTTGPTIVFEIANLDLLDQIGGS